MDFTIIGLRIFLYSAPGFLYSAHDHRITHFSYTVPPVSYTVPTIIRLRIFLIQCPPPKSLGSLPHTKSWLRACLKAVTRCKQHCRCLYTCHRKADLVVEVAHPSITVERAEAILQVSDYMASSLFILTTAGCQTKLLKTALVEQTLNR